MNNWKSKNRHKYLLQYHLIFVCKYRKKMLTQRINEKYAVFNTGLFTEYYEPIYFYLEPNGTGGSQKWYPKQICTKYDLGYLGVTQYPERANYFQNPELLVFDAKYKINVHL